jgi:3-dehydroquinate dehydratase
VRARAGIATIVIAFVISVLVFVANLGVWAQRQVFDPGALAIASLEALHEQDSEQAIAAYLMDQAIEEVELLRFVREPGERAVEVVLASGVLDPTYVQITDVVRDRMVTGNPDAVVVDLLHLRNAILDPIAAIAPGAVDLVPDRVFQDIVILEEGVLPSLRVVAEMTPWITALAGAAAMVLAVLVLAWSRRRSLATFAIGAAIGAAGAWSLVWVEAGRPLIIGRIDNRLGVVLAGNGYDVLARSLREQSLTVLLVGVVIAAGSLLWFLASQIFTRPGTR